MHESEELTYSPYGVIQGSSFSRLMALVMCLDIHEIPHVVPHKDNIKYYGCTDDSEGAPHVESYVDEVYGILAGKDDEIKAKIEDYLKKMQSYFNYNYLKINMGKTQIVIWSSKKKKKHIQKDKICFGKISLEPNSKMKVLAFIFNR